MKCWNCKEDLENIQLSEYKLKIIRTLNQLAEYHKVLGNEDVVDGIEQSLDAVRHING